MAGYDEAFFEYVNSGSVRSARAVLPIVMTQVPVRSVLDVGCGQGAWLSVWREIGVEDVTGIDGSYVDRGRLLFPTERFLPHDLTQRFHLGRRFDLVQCLEVAEHLPAESAEQFVRCLTAHGDVVLFSAAPKGQGGDNHVNEQDYAYWRERFEAQEYVPVDWLRPLIASNVLIEPWYRFNAIFYVARHAIESLPAALKDRVLPEGSAIEDVSPALYKLRKQLVKRLPVSWMTRLAKLKERSVVRKLRTAERQRVAR